MQLFSPSLPSPVQALAGLELSQLHVSLKDLLVVRKDTMYNCLSDTGYYTTFLQLSDDPRGFSGKDALDVDLLRSFNRHEQPSPVELQVAVPCPGESSLRRLSPPTAWHR